MLHYSLFPERRILKPYLVVTLTERHLLKVSLVWDKRFSLRYSLKTQLGVTFPRLLKTTWKPIVWNLPSMQDIEEYRRSTAWCYVCLLVVNGWCWNFQQHCDRWSVLKRKLFVLEPETFLFFKPFFTDCMPASSKTTSTRSPLIPCYSSQIWTKSGNKQTASQMNVFPGLCTTEN